MPATITTELGKVVITEDIIATIAGYAAAENYGIVGMSAKTTGDSLWKFMGGDNQKRGVKVSTLYDEDENTVDIDLYVTLTYGASLPVVAQNVITNVRYRVNEMTGLNVNNVNIHVEAIQA